jgi:integrase
MATITKRVGKTGTKYHVKIRLTGYPAQSASFDRLTDARDWASDTEADMRAGRHFKTSEAKRHTFDDVVERYSREVATTIPKEWPHRKKHLEWWQGHLGCYTLADLTPALIGEVRGKLQAGAMADGSQGYKTTADGKKVPKLRSNATVIRYMAALSAALGTARREWQWLEDNPVEKVSKPALPRGRVRFLSDDERAALLTACQSSESPLLYPATVLAISTGMRQGEMMALKWKDVDLGRGRATLHETKNGEVRVVAIAGHALELLQNLAEVRRLDSQYIFPSKDGKAPADLRSAWRVAVKRAKLADFRWHDLRHTTGSYLAMNGASLLEIAAVLGHKTLQMVQRYSHLSECHTTDVVQRMNAKTFGQ